MAVNSLLGYALSGSIAVKSEELETTNLHLTHVLLSRDIAGYENSVSRFSEIRTLLMADAFLSLSENKTQYY